MIERGVSKADISTTIAKGGSFTYSQEGNSRTGFYDSQIRLFVATDKTLIKTVVTNPTENYLSNVQKR